MPDFVVDFGGATKLDTTHDNVYDNAHDNVHKDAAIVPRLSQAVSPTNAATDQHIGQSGPAMTINRRLPRTSTARLDLATPEGPVPDGPVPAAAYARQQRQKWAHCADIKAAIPSAYVDPLADPSTVLYLAYGSNMAAATFKGMRGIEPLSATTVMVPTLQLTFDLPGLPYREPCFANTAVRKVPTRPPKVPDLPVPGQPGPIKPPAVADGNRGTTTSTGVKSTSCNYGHRRVGTRSRGWDGPLYGVVYEVTRADFAHIIATEGAGSSYQDVLVPCLPLAPRMRIPEKPLLPVPERPFFAHTLWAPQVPADDGDDGENGCDKSDGDDDNKEAMRDDGDGNDDDTWRRRLTRKLLALAALRMRPDPDYAQPSARYLGLLADGAREHELPDAYQAWLADLAPYRRTSCRQAVGGALLLLLALPFMALALGLPRLRRGRGRSGRMPLWLAVVTGIMARGLWWTYDHVLLPVFGDGERTEDADSEATDEGTTDDLDEEDGCRDRNHSDDHAAAATESTPLLSASAWV